MARVPRPVRGRGRRAATFIIVIREDLQQFGGAEPEDQDPCRQLRDGGRLRRGDDDRRNITGKATERISYAQWHAAVLAKLGLLLGLIQIMYQSQIDSQFQTHPAATIISLAALCISSFGAAALLSSKAVKVEGEEEERTTGRFLYCRRILDMLVLTSGVMILSCLVSVVIPNGLGWKLCVSFASIISALIVGWHFLSLPIFGRIKFRHGEAGTGRV